MATFAIQEQPVLQLLKHVEHFEQKKAGLQLSGQRDQPILPGMPGSSCQMHSQITSEIMKNLMRHRAMETSESVSFKFQRFKSTTGDIRHGEGP